MKNFLLLHKSVCASGLYLGKSRISEEEFMTHLDEGNRRTNWLGTMAVWLSGISALVYFFSSYTVRNYYIFLTDNFNKTLKVLFQ